MFHRNEANKSISFLQKECLIVFVSLFMFASADHMFALSCQADYKQCSLESELGGRLKVQNLKCIDDECKDTFLIADDDKWYVCESSSKRIGKCTKLFKTNTLQLQSALLDLLIENSGSISSSNNDLTESMDKRMLPFETLSYGRRKRYLPFETLNYGKRSENCDCKAAGSNKHELPRQNGLNSDKRMLPFETLSYGKRALPFETLSYGKRMLPFETLSYGKRALPFETMNFGKRAYIPIDGYIMGKRDQVHD